MKTMEEHEAQRRAWWSTGKKHVELSGISCPMTFKQGRGKSATQEPCEGELHYPNHNILTGTHPPKREVRCTHCKYRGKVIA